VIPEELVALQEEATKAAAEGRLETARRRLQECLAKADDYRPARLIYAHEIASLHWFEYGDGIEARDCSELVIATWKSLSKTAAPEFYAGIKPLLLNSMERLMVLATSQEVRDRWAAELTRVSPDAPLLAAYEMARAVQEADRAWMEGMVGRGTDYLKLGRNPPVAACILHLALACGRELHARPGLWKKAIVGYYLAVHAIGGKANKLFGNKPGAGSEIAPVYKHTLPFLTSYCSACPDDEDVEPYLIHATKMASALASENRENQPPSGSRLSWLQTIGRRLLRRS
jgi:hypothetical protein